eukprot:CAMPEP_0203960244 /NCGR_PEP_ID=MMETSP0359-20131031/90991_1 /ASSEMBLY_ACC=CAM_ASM_000338 /TAXON_ID=268821 /ORGANISM="Scrippsiella Hangoei, Strain SHTV-5" /LENGTH=136 /DNA_ID=CAMNT_0050894489 /DNA_START=82 /DNA_END=489 /DNA_ORIENTATION=+
MSTTKQEKSFLSNNLDGVTANFPHMDDPRFMSLTNQMNHCLLRFTQFARCARELGEEDTRCKYQYYRASAAARSPSLRIGWSTAPVALATWTCCQIGVPSIAASEWALADTDTAVSRQARVCRIALREPRKHRDHR